MSPNTARFPLGKLTNWYRQCRVTTVSSPHKMVTHIGCLHPADAGFLRAVPFLGSFDVFRGSDHCELIAW